MAEPTTLPWYRWAIVLYDRMYLFINRLDRPAANIGPALRVSVARTWHRWTLSDGTVLQRGERVGILHLNNDRMAALHVPGRAPLSIGLEFRRQFLASLGTLAERAATGGPLADVRAFSVTTIFPGLPRLGFVPDSNGLAWPALVGAYQRALLASLHPIGALRVHRALHHHARRHWLSREALLARYGRAREIPAS